MERLLQASAMQLARLVRAREVSPLELVETHIARIEEVNPYINALVADCYERARGEARAATEALARMPQAELAPLHGVPCTVKEFLAVEGMPNTGGLLCRKGIRAPHDATVVARLRKAGAIVLGVTNAPEGGLWNETNNLLYGRTRNPWDLARTSGGSSGGEAAIVAAGGSAVGVGGDIGGSIRGPAAFCGVVGHKATGRMIPNTGQFPAVSGEHSAYNTTGPIVRRVADVMPLLRIMAGPDGNDAVVRPFELGDPERIDLRNVIVYTVEDNGLLRVSKEMREAVQRSARALSERGARIETFSSKRLRLGFEIWGAMMTEAGGNYAQILGGGQPISLWRELARFPLGRSRHTGPALFVAAAEAIARGLPLPRASFVEHGRRLYSELADALGDRGVLLYPPYSRPAPLHHGPLLTPFDFAYTAIFNVLELPVTQVPVGFDSRGLPLGVQVAAGRGNDHLTVAVAAAIEDAFGGWVKAEPQRLSRRRGPFRRTG